MAKASHLLRGILRRSEGVGLGGVRLGLRLSRGRIDLQLRRPWEAVWDTLRAMRQLDLRVKVSIEMEPSAQNRITLDDSRRDVFGNPGAALFLRATERDRATMRFGEKMVRRLLPQLGAEDASVEVGLTEWEHHHMGTCRMGDNPATSVVDRDLRVHGCDNLYVAGSAAFVTGSVCNPTLALVALSIRLADHLSQRITASTSCPSTPVSMRPRDRPPLVAGRLTRPS